MAKKGTAKAASSDAMTVAELLAKLEELRLLTERYEDMDEDDRDAGDVENHVARERAELSAVLEPLVIAAAEAGILGMIHAPNYLDDELGASAAGLEIEHVFREDDTVFAVGTRWLALDGSDGTVDDGRLDPSTFRRVPICTQVVLEEQWEHEGEPQRVLHTRHLVADGSSVDFSDAGYKILAVMPVRTEYYAVYGSADDDTDLEEESWDLEVLQATDKVVFLGLDYPNAQKTNWRRRLELVRATAEEDPIEDSNSVWLRGEYRRLPRLESGPDEADSDPDSA
jgi:hypothetical protein